MAEQDILNAFNDCVDRINIGQSINDCLRDYPQQAAALRPMLEAGKQLQRMHVPTTEVAQAQARARFRFEESLRVMPPRRRSSYPIYRFASLAAAVLLIFVVISGSATLVAQSSLPGDQLYGLKLLSEQVRESLSSDPALTAQFNQRRIDEAQHLLSANRAADITFQGTISAITGALWTIGGLPVQVPPTTQGIAQTRIGDLVEVEGYTALQGELFASNIRLLVKTTQPTPTVVPTLVPTAVPVTPRPQSSSTPTFAPSPTQTPSPSDTPTLTETIPPPQPTDIVATPSPTTCIANPPTDWEVYVVQTGDTLSHLASKRGITLDLLMSVNCLVNPGLIVVGQSLYLPSGASVSPTPSNSGNGSQGGQPNATATDDHGGQNSGSDNSGSGSNNSGSGSSNSGSGDSHGGDSSGGHGSDG